MLITAGWLWTFSLAGITRSADSSKTAVAAGLALALSLGFRRSVMGFFRTDLDTIGDRITEAYLWTIVAAVVGLVCAVYVLAGGPSPFEH